MKKILDYWFVWIFIFSIFFLIYENYTQNKKNHNKVAECVLNYDFYTKGWWWSLNEYCKNPNSKNCEEFLSYWWFDIGDFYSCYGKNWIEYNSPIVECLKRNKIQDLYKNLSHSNYDKLMNWLSNIEKVSKNCVYLNN